MANATETGTVASAVQDFKAAVEALPLNKRISRGDANAIYALAYGSIQQGRYESAFRYFSLLTMFNPTNTTYLTGLGLSYKLMGKLDEAIGVYSWLAVIDREDPAHTLAIAECQLLKRDYKSAREALDLVIDYCRDQGGYGRILTRAEAFHSLIGQGAAPAPN